MMNRNRNMERAIRRRERERLADLNRDDPKILRGFIRITAAALAILACVMVLIWASAVRADQEAFAATLRRTRLIREEMTELGEDREYLQVPPLPEFLPEDGEPPEAIEIKAATMAETIPDNTHDPEEDAEWESLGTYRLTFYCPCYQCSDGWGHQTASGATAVEGITVAVDPRIIPYGTHLKIDGHEYVAQDCGGSIKGKRIDIFMESHSECLRHGIRKAQVYVKR